MTATACVGQRYRVPRSASLFVPSRLVAFCAFGVALACAAPASAQTVVFRETFDNGNATVANPRLINTYTGPTGMNYTADPPWVTGCNGWVAAWNSPIAHATAISATHCGNAGSPGQTSWNYATEGAQALGAYINGVALTAAAAQNNLAMMAYTAGNPGVAQTLMVQNATPIALPASPVGGTGRFLTLSFVAAAQNCFANHPLVTFSILNPGETQLGTGNTDLCVGGINAQTYLASAHGSAPANNVRVATYVPTGAGAATLVTTGALTFRLRNQQASGSGNDWGWDNFTVLDVTPSVTKADAGLRYIGVAKPLTFTITNTALDNAAKVGWGFTDTLPANVVVAPTPGIATTCGAGTTVTANAGAGTIAVANGNLPAGTPGGTATTCTITVNVVSDTAGIYTNGATNFTASRGLNLPPSDISMEWVRNRLTVTKISLGNTQTFSFSNNNDGTPATLPYTITTTAAGAPGTAGAARVLSAVSTTANTVITETPPAGWTITAAACTGLAAGQAATFSTTAVTIPSAGLSLVSGGRDVACTITNTLSANLSITKTNTSASGPSDLSNDAVVGGSTITYQLVVTNGGPGRVTGAVVRDAVQDGVTCPAGNVVNLSGSGVPAGSYTVANLTGAGITLGALNANETTTLSFQCTVQ